MQRRHAVAELGYQRTVRRRAYAVREVRTVRAEEGRVVTGVGGEEGVVDERFGAKKEGRVSTCGGKGKGRRRDKGAKAEYGGSHPPRRSELRVGLSNLSLPFQPTPNISLRKAAAADARAHPLPDGVSRRTSLPNLSLAMLGTSKPRVNLSVHRSKSVHPMGAIPTVSASATRARVPPSDLDAQAAREQPPRLAAPIIPTASRPPTHSPL
jgi:hypothetical protein